MAKLVTPIIGLAVVVALALAAVFGAMSLANPAYAQSAPEVTARGLVGSVILEWADQEAVAQGAWQVRWRSEHDDSFADGQNWTTDSVSALTIENDGDPFTDMVMATITGLVDGDEYTFQVRGGGTAAPVSGRVPATPTAGPDGAAAVLMVMPSVVGGEAELSWTFTDGSDVPATGWEYSSDGGTTWEPVVDSTGSTREYVATGLAAGAQDFEVRPLNVGSPGTMSNTVNETVLAESVENLKARAGDGQVRLTWNPVTGTNDHYSYSYYPTADEDSIVVSGRSEVGASRGVELIEDLTNGVEYTFNVYLHVGATGTETSGAARIMQTPTPGIGAVDELPEGLPRFDADSTDPGKNTRYEVEFEIRNPTNTLINDLVIELPDYGVPASMKTSSVTITAGGYTFTPEDVSTDGEEIFISIGDVTEDTGGRTTGGVYTLGGTNHSMLVVFRQSAGITNPTGAGTYFAKIIFGTNEWEYDEEDPPNYPKLEDGVPRKVSLDEDEGGLGDLITATGKGYKDGTTLTVFVDKLITVMWNPIDDAAAGTNTGMVPLAYDKVAMYDELYDTLKEDDEDRVSVAKGSIPKDDDGNALHMDDGDAQAPSGDLDLSDDVLCAVAKIGKDDVGKCEFTVTHPTFGGGLNYINAVDGRNGYDATPVTFDLEESIIASPTTGSPGETILVQVIDFTENTRLQTVQIGRQYYCGGANPFGVTESCPGLDVDASGSGNFSIDIPDWVRAGVQELKIVSSAKDSASTNVTLLGPRIQVNPSSVLANQRVSLIGTGFSPGAVIANDTDSDKEADHVMTVGGDEVDDNDINDGDPVTVDNGGNWSASVDLPLTEATTAEGERTIRVTDSRGRTGVVIVNVPAREVTVTPDVGRVGTIALVSGKNFPSKNDEGEPINIDVIYETNTGSSTRVSALPDASGRFEIQLRIPTTSAIPSSNTITVGFTDQKGVPVVMTLPHEVPEGIVTTSVTSGGPGSIITVMGEGFKSFVPVSLVKIGTLDVTPAPKPSTDGNGMVSFDITIPGLDVGIQTIEVNVGRTTASVGFTVTESGLHPGNIVEVGAGLEDLGDNLVNIWHFNNDLKSWSFYDGMEGSDLTHLITGETYLIQIKSTMEVILNRDTRNLTCVGGNCWNQIVW